MVSTPLKKYDCSQNGESSSNNRGGENKKLWNHHPGTFHLTQNIWTKPCPVSCSSQLPLLVLLDEDIRVLHKHIDHTCLRRNELSRRKNRQLLSGKTCWDLMKHVFLRKTNMTMETPAKWMVGRWNLFLGQTAYFHGRTVSFWKCKLNVYHMFETHPYKRTMCPAKNFSRTIKTIRSDKNVEDGRNILIQHKFIYVLTSMYIQLINLI